MNLSYQSSYSNILQLSQNEEEGKKIEYLNRFINNLSQTYGIPILQLQQIYFNNQRSSNIQTRSTIQYQIGRQLDYGDKIHINHSILKKMIEMIDKRADNKTQKSFYPKNKSKILSGYQLSKQQNQNHYKIIQVKKKLQEVIKYIDYEDYHKNVKNEGKIEQILPKISEESSFQQLSLQYSKDASDYYNNHSFKISTDSNIHFNDCGKETTSQIIQTNNPQIQKQQRKYFKQSLQRISEVLSGQSLSKQQSPLRNNSSGTSVNRSSRNTSLNKSLMEPNEDSQHDSTRKMILKTISNKIKKNSQIVNSKENIKIQEYHTENENINSKNIKNNQGKPLNKKMNTNKGLWDSYSKNTLVSYQSLDDLSKKEKSFIKKDPFRQQYPMHQSIENTHRVSVNKNSQDNHQKYTHHFHTQTMPLRQTQKSTKMIEDGNIKKKRDKQQKQLTKQSNIIRQYPTFRQIIPNQFNHQNIKNNNQKSSSFQNILQKKQFSQINNNFMFQPQIYRPRQEQHQKIKTPSVMYDTQNYRPQQYHSLPKQHQNSIPQPYQVIKHNPQVNMKSFPSTYQRNFYSQPIQRKEPFKASLVGDSKLNFQQTLKNNPEINVRPQYRNNISNPIPKISILQKPLTYANQFINNNYKQKESSQKIIHLPHNIPHQLMNQSIDNPKLNIQTVAYSPRNINQAITKQQFLQTNIPQVKKFNYKQPSREMNMARQLKQTNMLRQSPQVNKLDYSIVNKFQPIAHNSRLQKIVQLTENSRGSQTPHYGTSSYANQNDSNFQIDANQSKINSISSTKRLKKKGINLTQHNSLSQKLFRYQ